MGAEILNIKMLHVNQYLGWIIHKLNCKITQCACVAMMLLYKLLDILVMGWEFYMQDLWMKQQHSSVNNHF